MFCSLKVHIFLIWSWRSLIPADDSDLAWLFKFRQITFTHLRLLRQIPLQMLKNSCIILVFNTSFFFWRPRFLATHFNNKHLYVSWIYLGNFTVLYRELWAIILITKKFAFKLLSYIFYYLEAKYKQILFNKNFVKDLHINTYGIENL